MSDDVKVTFTADTSDVSRAIQTIGGAGGGGAGGGGRGRPPALPPPSGPLGPYGGGGRRRRTPFGDYIDVETVPGGGGGGVPPGKVPGRDMSSEKKSGRFMPTFGEAFSAIQVVGSFLNDAIDYATKVKQASIRSGQSVENIQRLTNAAVTQGISFDEVTSVLTEGNRRLGQGLVAGGSIQLGLSRLGVSMEQIRNKSVSTSEVLMKMADLYKQTGDDVQMANLGVSIFGNSFTSLIPMLKQGRDAISALGNEAGIMSKSEIESAALAKAQIERSKKVMQEGAITIAGAAASELDDIQKSIAFAPGIFGSRGGFLSGPFSGAQGNADVMMARAYYGRFAGPGDSIGDFAKLERDNLLKRIKERKDLYEKEGLSYKMTPAEKDRISVINGLITLANKTNPNKMPGFKSEQIAWATSLQAMGGGDVLSAMAQNPQDRTAENTAKAVEILQQIDNNTGNLVPKTQPTLEPGVVGAAMGANLQLGF